MPSTHDLIVIGGGAAGIAAARAAAEIGARALVVEAGNPRAGYAVNSTELLAALRGLAISGMSREHAPPAIGEILARERRRAVHWRREMLQQLRDIGVQVEFGLATIDRPGAVLVRGGATWSAPLIVLATGSLPRRPSRLPYETGVVSDASGILSLPTFPRSLVIVGAEAEGCEFASVYASLGVDVTLVERRRKLFRLADRDVLEHVHVGLQTAGVTVAVEEEIESIVACGSSADQYASVTLASGRIELCSHVLVLAGRKPALADSVRDQLDMACDDMGFVRVDEFGRTSVAGILAVGDVTGPPFRVGAAVHQARRAVAHALTGRAPSIPQVPVAVRTIPELAVVGVGEDSANLLGIPTLVGRASWRDRWLPEPAADPIRLAKLVFDRGSASLIGVQIVGGSASDLIHLGTEWLAAGASPDDIASAVICHPSACEVLHAAAVAAARQPRSRSRASR
jgi:NAD(P) transhydrogenase